MIAKTFLSLCLLLISSAWGSVVHSSSFEATSTAKINAPVSGDAIAEISELTDLFITVTDAHLDKWTLHLIDQSIPNATPQLLFDGNNQHNLN